MDRLARPGLDGQRQIGIEAAGAFPAEPFSRSQAMLASVAIPASITTSASDGAPRASSIDARVLSSLTAPESERREARAVEHQPQGQERAIAALLLEWPRSALGWAAAAPSKKVLVRS